MGKNTNSDFELPDEYSNPFEEEFEKEDVIPSISDQELKKRTQKSFKSERESEPDFESIANYNEELEVQRNFKPYYPAPEDAPIDEQEELQKNFKDFLILRKISGQKKSLSGANKLPSDAVNVTNEIVELQSLNATEGEEHKSSHIVTHKDSHGNVHTIEVICQCGTRTIIKLEYE